MKGDYKMHRLLLHDIDFTKLQANGYSTFSKRFAPDTIEAIRASIKNNDLLELDDDKRRIRFLHIEIVGTLVIFNIGIE